MLHLLQGITYRMGDAPRILYGCGYRRVALCFFWVIHFITTILSSEVYDRMFVPIPLGKSSMIHPKDRCWAAICWQTNGTIYKRCIAEMVTHPDICIYSLLPKLSRNPSTSCFPSSTGDSVCKTCLHQPVYKRHLCIRCLWSTCAVRVHPARSSFFAGAHVWYPASLSKPLSTD